MQTREVVVRKEPQDIQHFDQYNYDINYVIIAGNNQLSLFIHPSLSFAHSKVENVSGEPRVEGSTTAAYARLAEILRRSAGLSGQSIKYEFSTRYENMQDWAMTRGKEIFKWDRMEIDPRS